jgi:transcriptional regulator with XRE-family HTH domain
LAVLVGAEWNLRRLGRFPLCPITAESVKVPVGTVSEALRLIRVFHDLRQNELAERLGISKSYLSEVERGKKSPSIEVIQKYASEFQIPVSSILFFSEQLDKPIRKPLEADRVRGIIARKVISFLQFIEARAKDNAEEAH